MNTTFEDSFTIGEVIAEQTDTIAKQRKMIQHLNEEVHNLRQENLILSEQNRDLNFKLEYERKY
jgi:uncharacterized coiled-coil protein SlyX